MVYKAFSGLADLPHGRAKKNSIAGCIVLEGGAFRGVYSSGVLDALMENDINMECTIGVSAGALNGLNYVAGDIGRSARINLGYRHDKRYVGMKAVRKNMGIIGFDFVFKDVDRFDPMNMERILKGNRQLVIVATNCNNGKPEYFTKDNCSDLLKAAQASASMPYVSKMVEVDGIPCLDGGCSDKIPFEWAIKNGFEKVIVVRTRPVSYRKSQDKKVVKKMTQRIYSKYPEFEESLEKMNDNYNRQCDLLEKLEKQKRVFVVSPSLEVTVGRVERDMEKLGDLYYMGYNDMKNRLDELKEYLEIQ